MMVQEFTELGAKYKRRIVFAMALLLIPIIIFATTCSVSMYQNKVESTAKYDKEIEITDEQMAGLTILPDSVPVNVGMYMESITDVNVVTNSWVYKALIWFRWNDKDDPSGYLAAPEDYPGNRFIAGNGLITSKTLMIDRHGVEDGLAAGEHYQQYRIIAKVEKYFDTTRYPLESHQLKLFIEDERDMSRVRYVNDDVNSTLSPYLSVAGFDIINHDTGLYLNEYASLMADPALENLDVETSGKKTMEFVFVTRVKRAGYGLFLKAFLSLFGMLLWVCIGLFNNAYNRIDAMGSMSTGIFGAVSSMIVGMNLLSDARGSGLIEYINLFALAIILISTMFIIHINRARSRQEPLAYTDCLSKALFWCCSVSVVGTITALVMSAAI